MVCSVVAGSILSTYFSRQIISRSAPGAGDLRATFCSHVLLPLLNVMMASLPSPSFQGRGYSTPRSALILIAILVFLSLSSIDRRVALTSSRRSELTMELGNNRTEASRFLLATSRLADQHHRALNTKQQFVLSSGFHPVANPHQPYFVTIGAEGEHLSTLPDGHEDNPLSWLADLREPCVGRESIFYFVVPKVIDYFIRYDAFQYL
jgi:hypothetical protein